MYHIFCIHYSVEGHLTSLQCLVITNKAAMNIADHVSLLHVGHLLDICYSWVLRLYYVQISKEMQTDFQNGCTSFQSYQQWRSVSLSSYPSQHLLSPEFFILAVLTGMR